MNGEICEVCGREIKVSIFKNTGVCCELCRKLRAGEITRDKYDKEFGKFLPRLQAVTHMGDRYQ